MAYNNNIPQSTDQLSQSQLQILNNFAAIQTLIGVNHVNFNTGNQGKHNLVEFPVQTVAPTFLAGETGLWNQNFTTSTQNETYVLTNFAGGGTDAVPMTASIFGTVAAPAVLSTGWTFIPSGLLIKWTVGANAVNNFSLNGGALGPNYTQIIQAFITSRTVGANFAVSAIGTTTINVGVQNAVPGNWSVLTIGY